MSKMLSNLGFKLMSLGFKFRDFRLPRGKILDEVGIKPGFHLLDYGCGPGSYLIPASRLVTDSGKVYALDIQSAALQYVRRIIKKNDLTNVETILSDCATGLPDDSIDVVLLYDIFHDLKNPNEILKEIHRILKPGGILSFNDHHMKDEREILTGITGNGLFILSQKGERVYNFSKVIQGG